MFADHYACLMAGQWPAIDADTAFDHHALACALSMAREEALSGSTTFNAACGLGSRDLASVIACNFPGVCLSFFDVGRAAGEPEREVEEELLLALLLDYADGAKINSAFFAHIVARRAMCEDHLWQDLGLFERPELTRLLNRHFPRLARGNTSNMKWKKYFYRRLCEAEGFSICSAPSCRECHDFEGCFGEESGESRLARLKNGLVQAA